MSLSAGSLLESLGAHLAADSAVIAQVGEGGTFHARVDENAPVPFILYRLSKIDHTDAQGFGGDVESGRTPEVTILLSAIDEQPTPRRCHLLPMRLTMPFGLGRLSSGLCWWSNFSKSAATHTTPKAEPTNP